MKEFFIIANWKSHKTLPEAKAWLEFMLSKKEALAKIEGKTIIVCPPTTLLSYMKSFILEHDLSILLGAQDISLFDEGAYTGEVNGKQLAELVEYVIIGHSERRSYFHEDYELLKQKTEKAKQSSLTPIFCVQGDDTPIPDGLSLIAYEPVSAIGTGKPDSPEHANDVARVYREEKEMYYCLYGGSVTAENVATFKNQEFISGFLVGSASLDAAKFFSIIINA